MKESDVVGKVFVDFYKGWIIAAPNTYALAYGFEADLLAVTKSGYSVEYEVKLTKSDFLNDGKKLTSYSKIPKYHKLEQGKGPNRFYYVLPKNMVEEHLIPSWAGIIYLDNKQLYVSRKAKLLHSKKTSDKVIERLERSIFHRFWFNYFLNK